MDQAKRILITGGSGLVAGRIAKHLASKGFLVRLATRKPEQLNFIEINGLEVVAIDWVREESLRNLCNDVDMVIHAMGMNSLDCRADSIKALLVNGVYTASLLRAAIAEGVKRFIYVSTAHVYGNTLNGRITEAMCPSNQHPYATSHRSGEDAVLWADQQKTIEGVVLRLSNAFGRPLSTKTQCWMLLVNDLCRQAIEKRSLTLQSDGLQYRDFIPLTYICRVIEEFCSVNSITDLKKNIAFPSIFNVGGGNSQSILNMAKLIQSRVRPTLHYSVMLARQLNQEKESGVNLHYQSENMKEIIELEPDEHLKEIDDLLLFCQENFKFLGEK